MNNISASLFLLYYFTPKQRLLQLFTVLQNYSYVHYYTKIYDLFHMRTEQQNDKI